MGPPACLYKWVKLLAGIYAQVILQAGTWSTYIWVLVAVSLTPSASLFDSQWSRSASSSSDPHEVRPEWTSQDAFYNAGKLDITVGSLLPTGEAASPGGTFDTVLCWPGRGMMWSNGNNPFLAFQCGFSQSLFFMGVLQTHPCVLEFSQ